MNFYPLTWYFGRERSPRGQCSLQGPQEHWTSSYGISVPHDHIFSSSPQASSTCTFDWEHRPLPSTWASAVEQHSWVLSLCPTAPLHLAQSQHKILYPVPRHEVRMTTARPFQTRPYRTNPIRAAWRLPRPQSQSPLSTVPI